MYKFLLHNKSIDAKYLAMFTHYSWDRKAASYDAIVKKYPFLSFLSTVKYKDLFVMPFDKLVGIYYDYINVEKNIANVDIAELHKCFPYDNHSNDKILPFIEQHTHHSEATTCPYCDCKGINIYQGSSGHRNYHLDHFLDKGRCPLVAMSLHNLLPVCSDCNTTKGAKTFGSDKASTILLSPFNPKYDFENQVHITVAPSKRKDILKIRSRESLKNFVISMDFSQAPIYEQEVNVTEIMKRFYGDVNSTEHAAMIEIYRNIVDKRQSYERLDAIIQTQKLYDYSLLPSAAKHKKGIRKLYDKFVRDIISYYS